MDARRSPLACVKESRTELYEVTFRADTLAPVRYLYLSEADGSNNNSVAEDVRQDQLGKEWLKKSPPLWQMDLQ